MVRYCTKTLLLERPLHPNLCCDYLEHILLILLLSVGGGGTFVRHIYASCVRWAFLSYQYSRYNRFCVFVHTSGLGTNIKGHQFSLYFNNNNC